MVMVLKYVGAHEDRTGQARFWVWVGLRMEAVANEGVSTWVDLLGCGAAGGVVP